MGGPFVIRLFFEFAVAGARSMPSVGFDPQRIQDAYAAQSIQRGQDANVARWVATGEYYMKQQAGKMMKTITRYGPPGR